METLVPIATHSRLGPVDRRQEVLQSRSPAPRMPGIRLSRGALGGDRAEPVAAAEWEERRAPGPKPSRAAAEMPSPVGRNRAVAAAASAAPARTPRLAIWSAVRLRDFSTLEQRAQGGEGGYRGGDGGRGLASLYARNPLGGDLAVFVSGSRWERRPPHRGNAGQGGDAILESIDVESQVGADVDLLVRLILGSGGSATSGSGRGGDGSDVVVESLAEAKLDDRGLHERKPGAAPARAGRRRRRFPRRGGASR